MARPIPDIIADLRSKCAEHAALDRAQATAEGAALALARNDRVRALKEAAALTEELRIEAEANGAATAEAQDELAALSANDRDALLETVGELELAPIADTDLTRRLTRANERIAALEAENAELRRPREGVAPGRTR